MGAVARDELLNGNIWPELLEVVGALTTVTETFGRVSIHGVRQEISGTSFIRSFVRRDIDAKFYDFL